MNKLLDPLRNGAITIPGAHQLTLTGLRFAGIPTDDEFKAIDIMVQSVDKFHAWADGDVALEYVRREQHTHPGLTVESALKDYALARSKNLETTKARYKMAKAFKHPSRSSLSWSHHWVVWSAGIDGDKAVAWLEQAKANDWSVEALRSHIKHAIRPSLPPEPTIEGFFPPELQGAVDWVSGRLDEVDAMPTQDIGRLLAEVRPLIDYVDRLRARAAKLVETGV